mmetsp:Transcript_43631/g.85613  ORF Transcript_43631/g.85613 Transcript_43631/m.85613 type:complete len:461 (+) Transcript_43631:155-1537(+)|eukprot:CAMPEP_0194303288 /NCGR_PEP_ID=MMETSP0171-20130528/1175_1 /TAXON_ID=218684 /ORGANISM="Corethron pennatum, Strain L29A3" /LENGTH=460 /DNA_ID=CAMNT_0039054117 /DNA_START=125 /DNA_END=1507 /DNA_ORIENTATION=+
MVRALLLPCVVVTCGFFQASAYTGPPSTKLGDFLIQRAIQQQLYYSAMMRNEPIVDWLKRFEGHEHLDSKLRREGNCGTPGTYSATFDQLKTTPFPEYLTALGTEPDSSIEVKFVKPMKRLSAQERRNPYLNKQAQVIEIYDQPIITKNILTQLLNTAGAMVETWVFHLGEVEKNDLKRVANDRAQIKPLPTVEMMEFAELVKGGETAYSFFTGDEPMPLYDFDCRACDRFDTLRALSLFVDEVKALTPETAFTVDYLRREAVVEIGEDEDVIDLVARRRRIRRESFERNFVTGDDVVRGKAARDAALFFLEGFCDAWVPKLVKGDERSVIGKESWRHPPGMKEVRPKGAGVDAIVVFEALWEYQEEAAYEIHGGGELILPRLMGERLREIRSAVAAESKKTVMELVAPEIRQARLKYTDYIEEDDDGQGTYERFKNQADTEGERETYSHADIIREMGMG